MTMSATLSRHPPGARNDRALAMAAFQIESRSWGGLVQPLSSQAKRVLCLDAIGVCLASFRPSLEEALGARSARLARRALELLRADDYVPNGPGGEFRDALRALREDDQCAAVASVVAALTEYADAMPADLTASTVLLVMSACYEAVMHADRRARVTAAGRGDQALTRLISAQRGLIGAAALA